MAESEVHGARQVSVAQQVRIVLEAERRQFRPQMYRVTGLPPLRQMVTRALLEESAQVPELRRLGVGEQVGEAEQVRCAGHHGVSPRRRAALSFRIIRCTSSGYSSRAKSFSHRSGVRAGKSDPNSILCFK